MRKKTGILTLGLVLVTSTLVLAKGPNPSPSGIRVEGVITAIDPVDQQIVVDGVTIQVSPDTVIQMMGEVISPADLQVGMTVAACGIMDGDVLMAHRITVKYGGK